ncbi:hypothetical protein ACFLXU_03895 [Chloroflexota bacterium]
MLRIATKTKLNPEEAIKRAVEFFGPGGYGLEVREQEACYASFQGGGGGVAVTASAEEKGTSVELVSREWDFQVNEFIRKVH